MSARPAPAPFKAVVRTANSKMELQTSISEGLAMAFYGLAGKPKTRQRVLAAMYQNHLDMLETERAAKTTDGAA
jgi:hypothetical protein